MSAMKKIYESNSYKNKVKDWLDMMGVKNYTVRKDGVVDVEGSVRFHNHEHTLYGIPIQFGDVTGSFDCSNNRIRSLKGAPEYVGGTFNCCDNQIESLSGIPKFVGGNFYYGGNKLMHISEEDIRNICKVEGNVRRQTSSEF